MTPRPRGAPRTQAGLPHARGLTRDVKASTRPLLLPPSLFPAPALTSREGQQARPLSQLQPPLPAAQSVRPPVHLSSQWADWLPASPLIRFLNGHCARLTARCWMSGFL